ncbi:hypothetical protein FSP39_012403 [Pinctada imbricata]|uniref:C2H2-type domain-containing protein n=1 Tax=Pinctada imbricata TaxID=66713 RepID=A0AA88YVB2_PINIB|nr:hypothetical protein FSP39_012403 [Pinctada imbricata]
MSVEGIKVGEVGQVPDREKLTAQVEEVDPFLHNTPPPGGGFLKAREASQGIRQRQKIGRNHLVSALGRKEVYLSHKQEKPRIKEEKDVRDDKFDIFRSPSPTEPEKPDTSNQKIPEEDGNLIERTDESKVKGVAQSSDVQVKLEKPSVEEMWEVKYEPPAIELQNSTWIVQEKEKPEPMRPKQDSDDESSKKIVCKECGKKFKSLTQLRDHFTVKHKKASSVKSSKPTEIVEEQKPTDKQDYSDLLLKVKGVC